MRRRQAEARRLAQVADATVSTFAAVAGADYDAGETIWDRIAWVLRYSKGGVSWSELLAMDGERFMRLEAAINRLVGRENAPSKSADGGDL